MKRVLPNEARRIADPDGSVLTTRQRDAIRQLLAEPMLARAVRDRLPDTGDVTRWPGSDFPASVPFAPQSHRR